MATVYQTRRERFLPMIKMHGGTKAAVAEKLGITRQYMQAFAGDKPTKNIGDKLARHIEKTFGYPEGYLDATIVNSVEDEDGSVLIPLLDVRGSMGPGAVMNVDDEVIRLIRLSKAWIREKTRGVSLNSLKLITGKGDSMSPTFEDGSALLVDQSAVEINVDGVYVIDRNGELFIKRMQRKPSGGFIMISDNPKFMPQVIEGNDLQFLRVLGRVLFEITPRKV